MCSCWRNWSLSASWGGNCKLPWDPLEHHSNKVLKYSKGSLIRLSLCREAKTSWTVTMQQIATWRRIGFVRERAVSGFKIDPHPDKFFADYFCSNIVTLCVAILAPWQILGNPKTLKTINDPTMILPGVQQTSQNWIYWRGIEYFWISKGATFYAYPARRTARLKKKLTSAVRETSLSPHKGSN